MPRQEALDLKDQARSYIADNRERVKGFPPNDPAVYELYWTPSQTKARAHSNVLGTQRFLQGLWHSSDPLSQISTTHPLTYADRIRIRKPGDVKFTLGPHIDGGSLERWEDPEYSKVYQSILNGRWEEYDAFDAKHRINANMDLYNGAGACSMFRFFQGWLSMTDTGPGEGTMRLCPLLRHATAYLILRPFFDPLTSILGLGATFPGSDPGACQEYNEETHPHLDLGTTMVSVPHVEPGDFVAWHCDTIHGVDKEHRGHGESSVLYIPTCPMTPRNIDSLMRQRTAAVRFSPPPDYPDAGGQGESGYVGAIDWEKLPEDGLKAMGLGNQKWCLSETMSEGERVPQSHATFFHRPQRASPAALLYTASRNGVVGALNPKDGTGVWRQTLHQNLTEKGETFLAPGDGLVVTASRSGVTAWDALDGRLVWRSADLFEGVAQNVVKTPPSDTSRSTDFVALFRESHSVVRKIDGNDGKILWKYTDSNDYDAIALASTESTVYYVAKNPAVLKGSKIRVTGIDSKSGQESKQYTLAADVDYYDEGTSIGVGGGHDYPFLFWVDSTLKTIKVNVLGSTKVLQQTVDNNSGEDIKNVRVHATSGREFLAHIETTSRSWAEVYKIDDTSSSLSRAYSLPITSDQAVFTATTSPSQTESFFVRVGQSNVTLFSGSSEKAFGAWPREKDGLKIMHAVAEVVRSSNAFAVRVAFVTDSGEWFLARNGKMAWYRPEMLTDVETTAWADIESGGALAQELEIERHKSIVTAYIHRIKRHVRELPNLVKWLQSLPQTILTNLVNGPGSDKTSLASAQKFIIMASDYGLYAMRFSTGQLQWRTTLPPYDRKRPRRKSLFVEGGQVKLLIDGGATFVFDVNDGQRIASQGSPEFRSVARILDSAAEPVSIFVSPKGQPDKIPGMSREGDFLITQQKDQKVIGWSLSEEPKSLWSFSPGKGSKIIDAVSRPAHDPVASIGKVLGNRSVLYKYLSPNLALATSTSEDALTVTLLDAITGTILYTTTHPSIDTSSPISSVISENWFAYSFFGNPSSEPSSPGAKGHHLIITELYESPYPNDRGPLGAQTNYSAFSPSTFSSPPIPHTISQAFLTPQPISHLSVTQTTQGITSRLLLAYLPHTSALIGIPRTILDPRRPVARDPTSLEAQEEGLFRYVPFLDFDPKWYLSHSREVLGVKEVMARSTMLESTGLVFAWGHDVFGTRVSPSMAFDVLGKGFNRMSLVATVVALTVGVGVLAPMVRKKQVEGRWKML
ncbi:MAG: hypothetical protein Q9160_007308 [Pyrenula sp. 1 TL-2023]